MVAQIYSNTINLFNKLTTNQHFLSLGSHCDMNGMSLQELDYDRLKSLVFFPKFSISLEIFVQKLVSDKSASIQAKLRYLSYLLCVKIFSAINHHQIEEFTKSCFDAALYVKFSNSSRENDWCNNEFSPVELPIFQSEQNHLFKAIILLFSS